jgi:hypothetical protein
MNKAQLIADLHAEYAEFEALLNEIGADRLTQPIAPGQWSVKDIVAHITGWRRRTVLRVRASGRGEAPPAAPWPAYLGTDDDINVWLHAESVDKPLSKILAESRQVFDDLVAAVESVPEEYLLDPNRFPWMEGQSLTASGLFGHFHDEHEADLRRWLAEAHS